ncbi:MAG TPA: beta-ketoacyl synthase N-terminal-like domain-containing protein, partial [Chthoniobacterales bacterium]
MSLRIRGTGWVTPLGSGVSHVWERLRNREVAMAETISSTIHKRSYQAFRVPPEATAKAPAHPRLRRSSAISRFAVVAGLAALEDGGLKLTPEQAARSALIFAISNGGVVYTKRFYHEVVESGAQAASPLLFPETVFNAPASHLAAILGITGASYTLVGDGAVGVLAMKMAEDLIL